MQNHSMGRPKPASRIAPAALVGSGGGAGLWLALAPGGVEALLAAVALAVTAVLGAVWFSRGRAARRLYAAADAHAAQEIAREARWQTRKQRMSSARSRVS